MLEQEIIENNKLIAEFLGSKFINDAPEDYPNGYYYQPKEIEEDCPTGQSNDWCFNSSWDWLMPVVEKINNMDDKYQINIYSHVVTVFSYAPVETLCKFNNSDSSKIYAVYQAVIEFIKWYNTCQK